MAIPLPVFGALGKKNGAFACFRGKIWTEMISKIPGKTLWQC
jgi:hypothetical protein